MKEIIVNVDNYNENSIKTTEGDNLSEVYKIYICKNKRRIDLTNKIAIMAYVNEYGNKKSNILALNITNASQGEIELPITNVISSENGVYACQIAIYGENNSLEQTAPFSLIVENNIFSKISNTAINSSDFHILSEAIKTTNSYAEKLKQGTENIELQYADKLNEKMNKDDVLSMANMGQDVKEAMTGGSVAVVGIDAVGKINLQNNSVTPEKTIFLEQKNLAFTGEFLHGKKIQGDAGSGMFLLENNNFYILAINIDPNTTYSLVLPEDLGLEDGYYWLKVATSTKPKEDILSNFNNNYNFDGSFKYSKTDAYLEALWINTGESDKSVFIQLGKYKKPSYLEFLKDKVHGRRYKDYMDSVFPNFNCYSRKEVDDKFNNVGEINNEKIFIKKEQNNTYISIFYKYKKGYIGYRYGAYGDGSINLNTYRLIDIKTYDFNFMPQYTISNPPYDNEGVLKIKGEADYIGGVHGDEKNPLLSVFIDGKMVNFNDVIETYCDEIKFIVSSDIYHCDNKTNIAFKKIKQTYFNKSGVHVNNRWIAQGNIELEHVRACLLSVNKFNDSTKLIDYYYDDKVIMTPQSVPPLNSNYTVLANNPFIDNVFLTGLIQCEVWGVRGGDEKDFYSQITDFGDRIKPYFDCYTGKILKQDDILTCENNFIIKYN